jgi:hypothetical protein
MFVSSNTVFEWVSVLHFVVLITLHSFSLCESLLVWLSSMWIFCPYYPPTYLQDLRFQQFRLPRWNPTNAHCTMRDGWWVDMKLFFIGFGFPS